jgi:hypothetical protein
MSRLQKLNLIKFLAKNLVKMTRSPRNRYARVLDIGTAKVDRCVITQAITKTINHEKYFILLHTQYTQHDAPSNKRGN